MRTDRCPTHDEYLRTSIISVRPSESVGMIGSNLDHTIACCPCFRRYSALILIVANTSGTSLPKSRDTTPTSALSRLSTPSNSRAICYCGASYGRRLFGGDPILSGLTLGGLLYMNEIRRRVALVHWSRCSTSSCGYATAEEAAIPDINPRRNPCSTYFCYRNFEFARGHRRRACDLL